MCNVQKDFMLCMSNNHDHSIFAGASKIQAGNLLLITAFRGFIAATDSATATIAGHGSCINHSVHRRFILLHINKGRPSCACVGEHRKPADAGS